MRSSTTCLAGILLATFPLASAWAQAPSWQMALYAGGGSYSLVADAATDADGNVYVAGWFSNSRLVLGSQTLTNTVTSGSAVGFSKDAFIAKWSPTAHDFVWALRAGGSTDHDYATALTVDNGSVYVATMLENAPAGLAGGPATTGCFLTKLTSAGTLVWTQPVGGTVTALAAAGGNVYATGNFAGAASFGSTSFISQGSNDVFVTKLADAGATSRFAWTQRIGYAVPGPKSIAVAGSSVYVAGSNFNATSVGSTVLATPGAFVAKFADAGATSSVGWVQPLSSQATAATPTASVAIAALAVSGQAVYLAGSFTGTTTLGATTLTSSGPADLLVARLTDAGATATPAWAQQAGGANSSSQATALLASGNSVYLTGTYSGALSFAGSPVATASGGILVAKLTDTNSTASLAWLQRVDNFYAVAHALARSGSKLYVAGIATGNASFGSLTPAGNSGPQAFMAALADNAEPTPLAAAQPGAAATLAVYPNPARGTATVRVPAGAGPATLYLLDALGRLLRRETATAGQEHPLSLAGLAPGVYAVRVQAGEQAAVQKLLVE